MQDCLLFFHVQEDAIIELVSPNSTFSFSEPTYSLPLGYFAWSNWEFKILRYYFGFFEGCERGLRL